MTSQEVKDILAAAAKKDGGQKTSEKLTKACLAYANKFMMDQPFYLGVEKLTSEVADIIIEAVKLSNLIGMDKVVDAIEVKAFAISKELEK